VYIPNISKYLCMIQWLHYNILSNFMCVCILQNKPVMTLQNLYDFKMTSIWAFLIGMLTAFGFLFIFWIILRGWSNDKSEDKKLQPQNDKPTTMCSCIGRYCCKNKISIPIKVPNKVCHAERHKYPLFSYKRSPKLRS